MAGGLLVKHAGLDHLLVHIVSLCLAAARIFSSTLVTVHRSTRTSFCDAVGTVLRLQVLGRGWGKMPSAPGG